MRHVRLTVLLCNRLLGFAAVTALALLTGCDDVTSTDSDAASYTMAATAAEAPTFPAPEDFVNAVTNDFFPLIPGAVLSYRSETDEGVETTVDSVTSQTKTILGIQATVVHDQVFLEGVLIEDTFDWYAQDKWGNVWYLGESSCEIVNGQCASTEGSWEAGVDGAEAGIIMWADPGAHKGENYRQEFYEGVAEDMGKVLHVGVSVDVPADEFSGCLETMDWTPLEPGVREHKFYCPGTGVVLEVNRRGGRNELVSIFLP